MKPITIDGVSYRSLAEAARALGVSRQAIWARIHPQSNRDAGARFRERKNDPREGYDIDF